MSKFQVIEESPVKRCEICHCNDMFDPKTGVCVRCDGLDTGHQPINRIQKPIALDGEFVFDARFRITIGLFSVLCFLVLLAYFIFFPDVPNKNNLYIIAGILLGLTPGVLTIIVPNSQENINLFDKFMFSASCLVIFMMIVSLSFPQINKVIARDNHIIFLFFVSLFFGFVYESIFRIRKTISRFEVPVLSTVASSLFFPLIEGLAQIADDMTSIILLKLLVVVVVVFFLFNYFLVDKFWEKTKTSASWNSF